MDRVDDRSTTTFEEARGVLLTHPLSRRAFLKFTLASAGLLATGSLLAACGGDDDDDTNPTATSAGAAATATTTDEEDSTEPTATTADEEPTEAAEATEAPADEPTEASEDAATEASGEEPTAMTGTGAGVGTTHTIEMTEDVVFEPAELTVSAGDTVTWVTVGSFPHSSTCDPAKAADPANAVLPEGADPWDSGLLQDGQEFSLTFNVPGEYTYFCIPHESMGMVGKVIVEA
jgi:plastocyanin